VEDLDADVEFLVDPDDGGCGDFAADVASNPDPFAVSELGLANTRLPRTRWQPVTCALCPLAAVEAPVGEFGDGFLGLGEQLRCDPAGGVAALHHLGVGDVGVLR
jgi:hypothetical protein